VEAPRKNASDRFGAAYFFGLIRNPRECGFHVGIELKAKRLANPG
jgi:hypothetical protein